MQTVSFALIRIQMGTSGQQCNLPLKLRQDQINLLSFHHVLRKNDFIARVAPRGPNLLPSKVCTSDVANFDNLMASQPPFQKKSVKKHYSSVDLDGKKRLRKKPCQPKRRQGLHLEQFLTQSSGHESWFHTPTSSDPLIPEHLLGTLIAPFIAHRETFNNFCLVCSEVFRACKTITPPWPHGHAFAVDSVVQCVDFSSSGNVLACSVKHGIRLWNPRTGGCQLLESPENVVTSVAFSPVEVEGRLVLASGHRGDSVSVDKTKEGKRDEDDPPVVRLWDLSTMTCRHLLRQRHGVFSVSFSPNGQQLASGGIDQNVRIWNTQSGDCMMTLQGHCNWVYDVKFSPSGDWLASAGEDETAIWLWDLADGGSSRTLDGHSECVHCVAFSPNGQYLASGSDDETIRLWDLQAMICLRVLKGNECSVWAICFSPDGATISTGSRPGRTVHEEKDRAIRTWSVLDGSCTSILRGHSNTITSIVFCRNGRTLASAGFDRTVRLWSLASGV